MKDDIKLPSAINHNSKLVISPVSEGGVRQGKIELHENNQETRVSRYAA